VLVTEDRDPARLEDQVLGGTCRQPEVHRGQDAQDVPVGDQQGL
jgi:hypothetical protein